jgi:hypothetical protein
MGTDTSGSTLPWIDEIGRAFPHHAFADFQTRELPRLVEQHGHLVVDDLRGAPALAFRIDDGTTFTWIAGDGVQIVDGDAGAETLVELSEAVFSDFVNELLTANGAVRTERARVVRGTLDGWQRWEPAFQSLCSGRPVYGPAVWDTLVDRHGAPLDLLRSFAVDDPEDDLRDFLLTAGYLHVRDVFTADEVAHYGAEVERCRAHTTPDDGFSWWSVNNRGEEVVTRINELDRFSPALLELAHDPRIARFARLAGDDLRVCDDRLDGPMVFIKNCILYGNGGYGISGDAAYTGNYMDYNAFGTNTSGARLNVAAGAHDVALSGDPFTNGASGDFSLDNTAAEGAACRGTGFPGVFPAGLTTGYVDIGAVQHADPAGGPVTGYMGMP